MRIESRIPSRRSRARVGSNGNRDQAIVVGAGPAGVAAGLALKDAGVPPVVLEQADSVASSWRRRYERLRLNTWRPFSHLPNRPFPRGTPAFPTREQLIAHIECHAYEDGLELRLGTRVERIEPSNGGWIVATDDGNLHAKQVVVATGYEHQPLVPDWRGRDTFTGALLRIWWPSTPSGGRHALHEQTVAAGPAPARTGTWPTPVVRAIGGRASPGSGVQGGLSEPGRGRGARPGPRRRAR